MGPQEPQRDDIHEEVNGDVTEVDMGARIRARRLRQGMTLDDLSKRAGLTKSFLSQVERGRNSPSLNTLRSIAEALEVPMLFFFLPESKKQVAVVHADERRTLSHPGGGMFVELLVPDLQHNIELVIVRILPDHDSSAGGKIHRGDECFLVLEGSGEMLIGTETTKLEAGDSGYILANQHHIVRNTGDCELVIITALTPPSI